MGQGWVDNCAKKEGDVKEKTVDLEAPISPRTAPKNVRAHVKSVFTNSGTELPPSPEVPEWHYVDENEKTIGPVTTDHIVRWSRKVGIDDALRTYVWHESLNDWTPMSDVSRLRQKIQNSRVAE